MAVIQIPWPTNAMPARYPSEGQGDLINAYACKVGTFVEIRRTPGLKNFVELEEPVGRFARGTTITPDHLIHVWDEEVHVRHISGTDIPVANALPGTDPVTLAVNARPTGAQVVIISSLAAYTLDPATGTLSATTRT